MSLARKWLLNIDATRTPIFTGKSGGDDKSEKGGGKDDAGGKESDERHDPDGFYDIGDYESSCKDMCPDQKEGEAQALKEAKGKKEVIADGLWTCVSIL
eukprot:g10933.t1